MMFSMSVKSLSSWVIVGLALVGCAPRQEDQINFKTGFAHEKPAAPQQDQRAQVKPVKTTAVQASEPRVSELGTSVQGRPLAMTVFGNGVQPVLVIGGIHGSEPTSVDVAEGLLKAIRQNPQSIGDASVAIIPVANPDGCLVKSRYNARGVDLNRNFPANNWRKAPATGKRNYGSQPLSEPESRAIMNAIDTLHPRLIISIHSIDDGRHCNNYDGPAESIAKLMSTYNRYPVTATMGYPTPGSLGSFAGIDRKIPIITLELPRSLPGAKAWAENRAAIFAAINATR